MITLPELPRGYRWKYYYSRIDSVSKLRLQKRVLGFIWWHVNISHIHVDIYGSEQRALDGASKAMLDSLSRQLAIRHERNYGIYEGGKDEH